MILHWYPSVRSPLRAKGERSDQEASAAGCYILIPYSLVFWSETQHEIGSPVENWSSIFVFSVEVSYDRASIGEVSGVWFCAVEELSGYALGGLN